MPTPQRHANRAHVTVLHRLGLLGSLAILIACVACAKQTQKPPAANTPVPKIDTPVPKIDTPVPKIDTPVPKTDTPVPKTDTPAPKTDTPAPKTDTPAPKTDTPAPTTDTPAPTTDTPAPTTDTPAPTTDTPPSASDTPPPADVQEKVKQTAQSEDRVLRHAVFFKFKDSSTEEDVKQVVHAFRALPAKIDTIVNLQWGTNNSPEGLNDEFTHCFLLTFKDEAGRAVYLPHAEHTAFGDVLRPHMDKVFVVDYWGTPPKDALEKELKHAVFLKFKDDAPAEGVKAVEEAFAALPSKIDTIKAFEWGTNNSPEQHNDGFTHCFMVTFNSEDGRAAYLPHPEHTAFVEVLKPVMEKVRVIDFWADK